MQSERAVRPDPPTCVAAARTRASARNMSRMRQAGSSEPADLTLCGLASRMTLAPLTRWRR